MRRSLPSLLTAAIVAAVLLPSCGSDAARSTPAPAPASANAPPSATHATARTGAAPAPQFVANAGQWPDEVAFALVGGGSAMQVFGDGFAQCFERSARDGERGGAAALGEGAVVRTRFRGGAGRPTGELPAASRHTFLRGGDAYAATAFERVRVRDLAPGVDLLLRTDPARGGAPAYDLLLQPGADLGAVVADCDGARALRVCDDGALELAVPLGDGTEVTLRQTPPVAWQEAATGRRAIDVTFRRLGERSYGFACEDLDPALPTVVDPGLVWSTLLGGGLGDSVDDVEWREGQGIWVGGWAGSTDFPTTAGAFRRQGGRDGFVARLAEDGRTVVWATYLGGSLLEEVRGIALGPDLSVSAVGFTISTDFPVVGGAFQPLYNGASAPAGIGDAFFVRLSADGSTLLGGTYLGGTLDEVAEAVAVDASGSAFVCGWTSSPNFPTTAGVLQPNLAGLVTLQTDGFVAKVAPDGRSLQWSTYVGGDFPDQLFGIALDAAGRPTVVGNSLSTNWPVTVSAYRTTNAGQLEAVATRLNATGTALVWSTYLGGVGNDRGLGLAIAADGSTWLCGDTQSPNFPTTGGAFQTARAGPTDGYVAQLSANGQSLSFSSLLGGAGDDAARAVSIAPGGAPFVVGETMGGIPASATAPQPAFGGGTLDAFVVEFAAGGGTLEFATYQGGSGDDFLLTAVRGSNGLAVVGGFTFSADFPTTPGVLQPSLRGVEDGVVAQYDVDSLLDGSLAVAAEPPLPPQAFAPGEAVDALALRLQNDTGRRVRPQSVRVFVGGAGDARALAGVSIWRDDPATPATRDQLLDGPRALPADNDEVAFDLLALGEVAAGAGADLRVVLHSTAGTPAAAEFACAVLGSGAWDVVAEGAGGGPPVTVTGSSRIAGAAMVAVAPRQFAGDDDGDGRVTVSDLRRLCSRLGQPAGAADPDGDGLVTANDLEQERAALLGRAIVQDVPPQVARGTFAAVRGWFGATTPVVTLGGRVLAVATTTPREIAFRVDPTLPAGLQTLSIGFGAGVVVERQVDVQ